MDPLSQDKKMHNIENKQYHSPFLGNTHLIEEAQKIYKLNINTQERENKLLDLLVKGQYQYQLSPFCSLHALEVLYQIKSLSELPEAIKLIFTNFITSEFYSDTNMTIFLSLIESYKLIPELFINICTTLHMHFVLKQHNSFQDEKKQLFLEKFDIPFLIIYTSNILAPDIFFQLKVILFKYYKEHIFYIYSSTCIIINQNNYHDKQESLLLNLFLLDLIYSLTGSQNTQQYFYADSKLMELMLKYSCLLCNAPFSFTIEFRKLFEQTKADQFISITQYILKKNYSVKGVLFLLMAKVLIEGRNNTEAFILNNSNFSKIKSYKSNWTIYDEAVLFAIKLFSYQLSPTFLKHNSATNLNRLNKIKRIIKEIYEENKTINEAVFANKSNDKDFALNKIQLMNKKKKEKRDIESLKKENQLLLRELNKAKEKINELQSSFDLDKRSKIILETKTGFDSDSLIDEIKIIGATGKYRRKYSDNMLNISHIIYLLSPRCYKFLCLVLPLPSITKLSKQFSTAEKLMVTWLKDHSLIKNITDIMMKENKCRSCEPVTLACDAFSIELWERTDNYIFYYQVLPLSANIPVFPLHLQTNTSGHGSSKTIERLFNVADLLEQSCFQVRFICFDGDSAYHNLYKTSFNLWYPIYNATGLDNAVAFVRKQTRYPLADILHFVKQIRNKIIAHPICINPFNPYKTIVTSDLIEQYLHLGEPLCDKSKQSRMRDFNPLKLFTISNVNTLFNVGTFDASLFGIFLIPCTFLLLAQNSESITVATRKSFYKIAFYFFDQLYKLLNKSDEFDKGITTNWCDSTMILFFCREIDLIRILDTINGILGILDEEIQNLSLNRVTTHPTENSIGHIRTDAKGLHTADRSFQSCARTLEIMKIKDSQGIKTPTRTRVDIGGVRIHSKKAIKSFNLFHDEKDIVIALFAQIGIGDLDDVKIEIFNKFKETISDLCILDGSTPKIYKKSSVSVSSILSRLLAFTEKKGAKNLSQNISNGEQRLVEELIKIEIDDKKIAMCLPNHSSDIVLKMIDSIKNAAIVPDENKQIEGKEQANRNQSSNTDIHGDPIDIQQINEFLDDLYENKNEIQDFDIFDITDFADKWFTINNIE